MQIFFLKSVILDDFGGFQRESHLGFYFFLIWDRKRAENFVKTIYHPSTLFVLFNFHISSHFNQIYKSAGIEQSNNHAGSKTILQIRTKRNTRDACYYMS